MEGDFAYWVMHASPIALVGIPVLIFAVMLLILCWVGRVPFFLYAHHTLLWLPILVGACIVSVAAWQRVAAALNFWPAVLVATPLEIIFAGCLHSYYYCWVVPKQKSSGWIRQIGLLLPAVLVYLLSMGSLGFGGAWVWSQGMKLISGSAPQEGFVVAWGIIFAVAITVGVTTGLYLKNGFSLVYSQLSLVYSQLWRQLRSRASVKAAVRAATECKAADPELSESISRDDLRFRFDALAELLQIKGRSVTKEVLLQLYEQDFEKPDCLRIQKETKRKEADQAQRKKLEEERQLQEEQDKAAQEAIETALEILKGRTIIPPNERTCELYRKHLTSLAEELKNKDQKLTSDYLLEHYDERWDRSKVVNFRRVAGGEGR